MEETGPSEQLINLIATYLKTRRTVALLLEKGLFLVTLDEQKDATSLPLSSSILNN